MMMHLFKKCPSNMRILKVELLSFHKKLNPNRIEKIDHEK